MDNLLNLIDLALRRISASYRSGMLAWLKGRPRDWKRMTALEREINGAVFKGNKFQLSRTLSQYEGFLLEKFKAFKSSEETNAGLFQKG